MKKLVFLFMAISIMLACLNLNLYSDETKQLHYEATVRVFVWNVAPSGAINPTTADLVSVKAINYHGLAPIFIPVYYNSALNSYDGSYSSNFSPSQFPILQATANKNGNTSTKSSENTPPLTIINIFFYMNTADDIY